MRRMPALLLALAIAAIAARSEAQTPTCKTPRESVDSVFAFQQERVDLGKAATCLERTGRSQVQLKESARRIKVVYDALGAWVAMDKIPADEDHQDAEHKSQVTPHPDLPEVVVTRQGGKWLWAKRSLDWVDRYYNDKLGWLDKAVSELPPSLKTKLGGVALWQYLALLLLASIGLLARRLLRSLVAGRLRKLGEKLDQKLDQQVTTKIIDVIADPGATLVTAVVLRLGYPQLMLPVGFSSALASAVRVLITASLVWAVYLGVDVLSAVMVQRATKTDSRLDDQLVPLVRKSLKVVVVGAGILVVLQNLHVDVTALLATASIGTLAIGLAARDTLANLFGSISIFVDSPFQIGDWINVDGMDGTVEEVGFRSTRIRTFYNSVLVIPNAKLADAKIDNYGQRKLRRTFIKLGIGYDSTPEQIQAFVEGIRAIIQANPKTHKDSYEVHFSGFGGSALEIMLYFFFKCDTWTEELTERHNMYLEILRLAQAAGVAFAFPTQTLHVDSLAAPEPRKHAEPRPADELADVVLGFGPEGALARPAGPRITATRLVPGPVDRGDYPEDLDRGQ